MKKLFDIVLREFTVEMIRNIFLNLHRICGVDSRALFIYKSGFAEYFSYGSMPTQLLTPQRRISPEYTIDLKV